MNHGHEDPLKQIDRDGPNWAELGSIDRIIDAALEEDLASGDVTTRATVSVDVQATGKIIAKQRLILCGGEIAVRVFARVDPRLICERLKHDCDEIDSGTAVLSISGCAQSILVGERVALNLLQRSCAVATLTRAYVRAAGPNLRIVDTRKTMPGLRAIDRYSVRCGGGHNHRNDLGSGVLIKENHIRAAGGISAALAKAIARAPHGMRIECEVQTLGEVSEAIRLGAEVLLLDNMDDATVAKAVALRDRMAESGRVILEVSGNVTLARLPALAALDVDLVSVGALTHSAPAVDLSLLFELGSS